MGLVVENARSSLWRFAVLVLLLRHSRLVYILCIVGCYDIPVGWVHGHNDCLTPVFLLNADFNGIQAAGMQILSICIYSRYLRIRS